MNPHTVKVPQMMPCSLCGGHGMRLAPPCGDVEDCYECGGGGVVEARDARGRFLPWQSFEVPLGPVGEPDDDRPF